MLESVLFDNVAFETNILSWTHTEDNFRPLYLIGTNSWHSFFLWVPLLIYTGENYCPKNRNKTK
jgi:hypothetical protein